MGPVLNAVIHRVHQRRSTAASDPGTLSRSERGIGIFFAGVIFFRSITMEFTRGRGMDGPFMQRG